MLETLIAIVGLFMAYTLRKTDSKIDVTALELTEHKLNTLQAHAAIRADITRDFATRLELRNVEQRATEANKEVLLKLDRLIERLIDNPQRP